MTKEENLDMKLTQLGLRIKNMVVIDMGFPEPAFPEFRSSYESRYIYMPCRCGMVTSMAGGLASLGKVVLIHTPCKLDLDLPDSTLNVKLLRFEKEAVWDYFEEEILEFGPSILLVPSE